jgi:hypothetical protein
VLPALTHAEKIAILGREPYTATSRAIFASRDGASDLAVRPSASVLASFLPHPPLKQPTSLPESLRCAEWGPTITKAVNGPGRSQFESCGSAR